WYSYTPYQFPVNGGRDIIAPFWTDIDNRGNGVISYQQFTSGSVLTQATQNINQYFPQLSFSATWVFVATWDRVAYYPFTNTACVNSLPYYRIEGKNEHRGSAHVSWTRLVRVFVYDEILELVKDHPYEAKVNGTFAATPFSLRNGTIQVYQSGFSIVISTAFGLVVTYDAYSYATINVPYDYQNATCGLCGNFNYQQDDFRTPSGEILSSDVGFGDSWKAVRDTDPDCQIRGCSDSNVQPGESSSNFTEHCNIMASRDGPFAQCHSILDPQIWIRNCRDNLGQTHGARESMCEALRAYAVLCQQSGVSVGEWRNITNCDFQCPAHSHYEECGTSCPAACPSLSFPFPCTRLCQEGCQCDNGLVLSGDQCVPPTGCGCFHEGRYRQSGEQFWFGQQCQFHCVCDGTSGFVNCSSSSCQDHEICHVIDGEYGCHPRPSATCSASGDPHYTSFDGHRFDFQGTCHYTLATVCNDTLGLPYFQVIARNEPWNGLSVSITVEVYVNVSGHLVHVSHDMYGTAEIDSETRNLPAVLDSGRVSVSSSGRNTFITTDFGLSVSYDGSWVVLITVPGNYSGATCGLCGNFNGDSNDDFRLQSGRLSFSAAEFGADWKVGNETRCDGGCGDSCPTCQDPSRAQSLCGIITDNQGPLSFCHADVDPLAYYNDCVFDLCLSEHRNDVLCRSIETYVSACQSANVRIYPWRENTTCRIICPANSHYELCGSDCGHTCSSSINVTCERTCREGCFCNESFVRSGSNCVPVEQCGCSYNGFYFQIGEQFWTEHCLQHCECLGANNLHCISTPCSSTEECVIRNGRLGCYSQMSTCMVTGDPHYYTFDGDVAHFQGTCSYEISQTCGNVSDNGLQFRVVATNMHRGSTVVSFVSVVDLWLTKQQEQTQITIGKNRKIKVNGNAVNSSTYQISNLAEIYQKQNFIVVNASHELMVYFDGQFTLLVRLGPSFHGSVCGMCGNNNGDPTDDKTRPNGERAQNDIAFGNSWKSNTSGPGCGASDQPVNANDCPFREEYSALCNIITNTSGPFQHCHFRISPESYFNSCVYDLCAYPESLGQDLLCSAVEAYDAACTMLELMIPNWRSDLSCSRMDPCEDLHCTEDEWCGEKDGNYGCFCNENYLRQNPDSYDSIEICESSSGNMSLSRCQLFEAGFLANNLHLHDPNCNGTIQDGRLVFHFDNDDHICGTNLTANGTHFIYENIIQGEMGSTTGSIHRNKTLELSFSCIYKLSESLSMDREINPIQSIVHKTLPGKEGMYQIKMIPYKDSSFSHPYNGSINIEVGEQIYIPCHSDRFLLGYTSKSEELFCSLGPYYRKRCFPGYHHRSGRSLGTHDSASISMGPFIRTTQKRVNTLTVELGSPWLHFT
ncbi:hypothetical protein Q7C36_004060, partial [Tachysurus vachellii]